MSNGNKVCPNCKTVNAAENLFCQGCGQDLTAPPQPSSFAGPQGFPQFSPAGGPQTSGTLRIDKLGRRWDGYATLITGAGGKEAELRTALHNRLSAKGYQGVAVRQTELTPGGLAGKRRAYTLSNNYAGATLTTYVGAFGADLFVVWDLYKRVVIKWLNIAIMVGIAAVLGLLTTWIGDGDSFMDWIRTTFGYLLPVGFGGLVLGRVLRGHIYAFFIETIDTFVRDDILALMLAVHAAVQESVAEVGIDIADLRVKLTFNAGRKDLSY